MALRKVKTNIDRLFDKNLTDLVRGLRNNKDNEASYIANCIEEIKQELKLDNINVKCNAVAKLTYLQMCGYDISFASFNIIETMSSNKFTCKRVGYLAASQCFHPGTDLLMLTTNTVKKDLNSVNQYDAGTALSGLSCFISADLSRDLANDIMTLMSSTKPYLRMKSVLMMYKIFLNYPDALKPAFPKLKEKLEDPDPGVQSAAVNVICELARKNPKNYLSLAPIFFKLMTTSTNNWMLIKIIKLFGALTPLEPRLGKKLIEPLTNLIHNTTAMSLLYECINTVIAVLISISTGLPNHLASIQLCVQKLLILIQDSDQNLKYLGLLALGKILKTHPKSVSSHKDLILTCLDDKDESIRLRALDLLYGMVSKKNLMEIVKRLLGHIERAEGNIYRDELLFKVIEICSQDSYQHVTNFEWYITVIVELIQLESNSKHGSVIADQLLDVAVRVEGVRKFVVSEMTSLLDTFPMPATNSSMYEVFYAAAWIVGEFGDQSNDAEHALSVLLIERPIPGHVQAVYVQNIVKLYTNLMEKDLESGALNRMIERTNILLNKLPIYISSGDIEVQERASSANVITKMIKSILLEHGELIEQSDKDLLNDCLEDIPELKADLPGELISLVSELSFLYAGELNPVAKIAQRKVLLPEGLNLDVWINKSTSSERIKSSDSSSGADNYDENQDLFTESRKNFGHVATIEQTAEEIEKIKDSRKQLQMLNPNYLKTSKTSKFRGLEDDFDSETKSYKDLDEIPIAELNLDVTLKVHSKKRSDKYLIEDKKTRSKSKQSSKKSKKSKALPESQLTENSSDSENELQRAHVNTKIEMPDGVAFSKNDGPDKCLDANDPHLKLNIELESIGSLDLNSKSYEVKKKSKSKSKESKKKDKKKHSRKEVGMENENILGHKTEKRHKKSKKTDFEEKGAGLTEYEETFGISTPSKEQ